MKCEMNKFRFIKTGKGSPKQHLIKPPPTKPSSQNFVGKIPTRTELTVLPADSEIEPVGWFVKETIGASVSHFEIWMFKHWYEKILYKRFWLHTFRKFSKR